MWVMCTGEWRARITGKDLRRGSAGEAGAVQHHGQCHAPPPAPSRSPRTRALEQVLVHWIEAPGLGPASGDILGHSTL